MRTLTRLVEPLDRLSAALGQLVSWLCILMILLGAYNAVARYLGRFVELSLSSNAYIELQWYLFSAVFLLGAADALRADAHVRVDVLYGRFSPRTQALIDLAGTLLFLLPFCGFAIYVSWPAVHNSFAILEQSPDPGGLPRYPIKALIPLSFALVILQGLSQLAKRLAELVGAQETPQ